MNNVIKNLVVICSTIIVTACGSNSNDNPVVVQPETPRPITKVVVIGAGISGIKAAHKLSAAGFDVTVLEGRNRVGGRTWSNNDMGTPLDMGASWIHGIKGNPIHQLATDLKVEMVEWDYDNDIVYDYQGNIDYEIDSKLATLESDMIGWFTSALTNDENASIQDAADIGKENGDLGHLNEREINFMVNSFTEQDTAAPANNTSIAGILSSDGFYGPDVIFPKGYDVLAKTMATDLDVKLNTWVSAINYEAEKVLVETSQGNYEADYVIVTVPLGVLKKNVITFTPVLPPNKQDAIDALDMGVLNKVYLKFDNVFWDNSVTNIAQVSEHKGHWSYWINLAPATGMPILTAFNVADYGTEVEQFNDKEIIGKAMANLKKFYSEDIPQPTDYLITRWASDPFSYGAYSYIPKGATAAMRDDLAEPVNGKVLFAGEATNLQYPSTVHGAYLSGEREADRIISMTIP
ncbi:MAG: monoamine oxidase [Enterobacterales bacterium]|jgi:monoamine oxidase